MRSQVRFLLAPPQRRPGQSRRRRLVLVLGTVGRGVSCPQRALVAARATADALCETLSSAGTTPAAALAYTSATVFTRGVPGPRRDGSDVDALAHPHGDRAVPQLVGGDWWVDA